MPYDYDQWRVVLDDCEDAVGVLDNVGGNDVGWERWFKYLTNTVQLASNPFAHRAALRSALVDFAAICLMWARKL